MGCFRVDLIELYPKGALPKTEQGEQKTNYYSVVINVTFLFFFNFLSSSLFLLASVLLHHEGDVFLRPKQENLRIKDNINQSPISFSTSSTTFSFNRNKCLS